MDFDLLTRQVRYNCDVSDAHHAGLYSVCGLAMRLRDLYKWAHSLQPWQEGNTTHVLEWIGQKEDLWETLLNADYRHLSLNGEKVDPFATQSINAVLRSHKLFLGAGYAHRLKPTFFLAQIDRKSEVAGHTVWQLGRERARDLLTLPAFSQDGEVVLRTEAGRMFLWDQMAYINKSGRWAMAYALRACGLPDAERDTLRRNLETIWRIQKRLYIRHEIGELEEDVFDRATWRRILADYPHTPVELLIRGLKDLLADTGPHGTLSHLILQQDRAGLGLHIAFGASFGRALTNPLVCAFEAFVRDANWSMIADAVQAVRETAIQYTRRVIEIYNEGGQGRDTQWVRETIEASMRRWGLLSE